MQPNFFKINKETITHDVVCSALVYKNYSVLHQKDVVLKDDIEKIYVLMEKYLSSHVYPDLQIKQELQGILKFSYLENFAPKYQKRINKNLIVYKDGWYQCGPATAYVIEEEIENEKFISVSFKGTDQIKEFKDYLDLKKYFIYFLPLVYSIMEYALKNNLGIKANGHSLGGTMVEYFAEECERFGVCIQGTTFGSPGSQILKLNSNLVHFKHNYDFIPKIGSLLYKPCGLVINLHTPNRKKKTYFHYTEEYVFSVLNLTDDFFNSKINNYLQEKNYLEMVAEFINEQLDIDALIDLKKIKIRRFIQKSFSKNQFKIKKVNSPQKIKKQIKEPKIEIVIKNRGKKLQFLLNKFKKNKNLEEIILEEKINPELFK